MAPRGRSTIAGGEFERNYDSSPDPLALSANENALKTMRITPRKAPLTATTSSKQNTKFSLPEMDLSSPSKSMVLSTPRTGHASPWRIKVTVQAEPGSDEENAVSPSVKRVTRTKTTIVPLKDADMQSPVKRPRGRPRKSDAGTPAKLKRNGTPVKRRARSRSSDDSVVAIESGAADVDTDVPPKRRRGRPRKSIQPLSTDDEAPTLQAPEIQDNDFMDMTDAPPETSGSKNSARFTDSPVYASFTEETTVPVLDTPARTELGKTLRARRGTPHAKKAAPIEPSSDLGSEEGSDLLTPSSGEENDEPEEQLALAMIEEDGAEEMYGQEFEDEEDDDVPDMTNFALEEGTTRMPDDTTVIDSENFSMISVDSLRSHAALDSPHKPEGSQAASKPRIGSLLQHEYLKTGELQKSDSRLQVPAKFSPAPVQSVADFVPTVTLRPSPRYETPAIDNDAPSMPPAIESIQSPMSKTENPPIGRAVTAGVALQGVLDPTRLTPQPAQKALDAKRDELDDLFRGFSEGTRKELQAGLRLGEQLAQSQSPSPPSATESSSSKAQSETEPKASVYRTQRKYRQSRLLTPEEHDSQTLDQTGEASKANDVQYPSLSVSEAEKSLMSPSESEDEMSWRVETPPVNVTNERSEMQHGPQASVVAQGSKQVTQDDYADIWQEEASRSSNSLESEDLAAEKSPQLQDLFADDGPIKPARGKLPRTWRRTSAHHFQYSDEAESPQQPSLSQPHSSELGSQRADKGKAKLMEVSLPQYEEVEEDAVTSDDSDGHSDSDDTGMFFQSNMPNVFNKQGPSNSRQRTTEKQSLSTLLKEGESLVPDSSPPVAVRKASSNPFLDTPPHFTGFPSSPRKSSPLRREIRSGDISSDSPRRFEDESTLPLPQSSPFHTFVDGVSGISTASDQKQFRVEMEGSTASTILRVRNEANQYLDAYKQQERTLDEIQEVTELSRTWQHNDPSRVASSPPHRKQEFAQSMLSPTRRPVPLFSTHQTSGQTTVQRTVAGVQNDSPRIQSPSQPNTNTSASTEPQQQQPGLLTRVTSTFLGTFSRPAPPPPHPILARLTPLPKVEPWTKTHYKQLDKLYTTHLKHPTLFSTSLVRATPLSQTNEYLLNQFLATNKKPYIGATFAAWGYSMEMTEELLVLCAVYMQMLTLASIDEYEQTSGRTIQIGDCGPGRVGDTITGDDVVRRLATVVMGEAVRRDEKTGRQIDRSEAMTVEWPQ